MCVWFKKNWKYGRRLFALLLVCGFLLPLGQSIQAAPVVYQYDWVKSTSQLPTDGRWHDYFIAWEDTGTSNKYWFTDYNWYTADGDSNIDVGGSSWMEYKAVSTLKDPSASSFTSNECYGHMQIKYAGVDTDNGNSPKYYIRLSESWGNYKYLERFNPDSDPDEAEPFTFVDKGDTFHIFINIKGQADKYLTRDGDQLEISLSSSSSEDEYPMRVYRRSVQNTQDDGLDEDEIEGRITMYEYEWVDTIEDLLAMTEKKGWQDVLFAWEDANGSGTSNPDKVWYTHGIWTDEDGDVNYNETIFTVEYYSNATLGSDPYTSPYANSFVCVEPISNFQLLFDGWDGNNPIKGVKKPDGKEYDSPQFYMRMQTGRNAYVYYDTKTLAGSLEDLKDRDYETRYTIQPQLEENRKNETDYFYRSCWIYNNLSGVSDNIFTRYYNRMDSSSWALSKYWEYPFRVYSVEAVEYDALVKSFTIGAGTTYNVDRRLIVQDGVTITVENGGILTVDRQLYNNGRIVVKPGGTLIVNSGGYITPFGASSTGSEITLEGGNMIIMKGGKVLCDRGSGRMNLRKGASLINRGLLVIGNCLDMRENSMLYNESGSELLVGFWLNSGRGGLGDLTFEQVRKNLIPYDFVSLVSGNSQIINNGTIYETYSTRWQWSGGNSAITGSGRKWRL